MNLIYFVIGGDSSYASLLEYCIHTIRCTPSNDAYDLMIMCDANYRPHVEHLPARIHVTPNNETHVIASMRKTEIFSVPGIEKYDKILYLDCDIVVQGSLEPLFGELTDQTKLYVLPEDGNHTGEYWHRNDRPYDQATLDDFAAKGVLTFNCGQFAFVNSPHIRAHMNSVATAIQTEYDPRIHFYEQVFMNDVFNRSGDVTYELTKHCLISNASTSQIPDTTCTVTHFANASYHYTRKLALMKNYHMSHVTKDAPPTIESREVLSTFVSLPGDPIIAEIGVFRGQFTEVLVKSFNPKKMIMIDPWEGDIYSGDQDGNDVKWYKGDELYSQITEKFMGEKYDVQRAFSRDAKVDLASLDLMYIDGDHSYEGVRSDLELAMKWVKYGGWICGHDFAMNPAKTNNNYDFGVRRAVTEFCFKYGMKVWCFALDGCISFIIRK